MFLKCYKIVISFVVISLLLINLDCAIGKPVNNQKSKQTSKKKNNTKSTKKSSPKSSVKTKKNVNTKSAKKVSSKKPKKTKKVIIKKSKVKFPAITITKDSLLGNGAHYMHVFIGNGHTRFSAHVLTADFNKEAKALVLKGGDHVDDLVRLHDMIAEFDTTEQYKVYGATNANFWKAYSNLPIGPTIKNGELIEMKSYKEWSSAFWDDSGLVIDNFIINGLIQNKSGQWLEISYVNHRRDTSGIVMYNRFGGDTIPYLAAKEFEKSLLQIKKEVLNETYHDSIEVDSTELEFDIKKLQQELIESKRFEKIEYSMPKLRLIGLDEPSLNSDMRYIVVKKDTTTSIRPNNGVILSLGLDFNPEKFHYKIGDTLTISFNTTSNSHRKFLNGVCGTPRLVREGAANHEAMREGSKGRRFISKPLPRTAIGVDKSGSQIFIVAVEPTVPSEYVVGANLSNLATLMKKIGCYNAMNLDGGGSTVMVVNGKNVTRKGRPDYSRRISVGIAVGKKK